MSKITQSAISLKLVNQKKVHLSYIFLHLSANLWVKIKKYPSLQKFKIFLTSGQSVPLYRFIDEGRGESVKSQQKDKKETVLQIHFL